VSDSEPIAWAVLLQGGDRIYDAYAIEEEAKAIDEAVTGNHGVVALYRSPTLTDEEREAVEWALEEAVWSYNPDCGDHPDTLRGLLERLRNGAVDGCDPVQ
jgi:hypothetical protein